jgi:DNA-binding CsgD family transcriptional regulator
MTDEDQISLETVKILPGEARASAKGKDLKGFENMKTCRGKGPLEKNSTSKSFRKMVSISPRLPKHWYISEQSARKNQKTGDCNQKMKVLTDRQKEILDFISSFISELTSILLRLREIASHFNISVKGAYDHVTALKKKNVYAAI